MNADKNQAKRLKKNKWQGVNYLCFALALIPIVSFAFFNIFPVVISFVSMFTDMEYNQLDTMRWNNFENFINVFQDDRFWLSWKNTLIMGSAPFVTLVIALIIAVLLNQKIKGETLFQVLFFIPYICSGVAVAIMWKWIFDTDLGVINDILGQKINWLNNIDRPWLLQVAVYITILWQAPAYGIVMYKAALRNVNPALYEAASVDGANGWHQFWHITMPSIKSVTLFLLLASINQGLALFEQVTILAPIQWTGIAGPEDVGLTVNYYIYLTGVQNGEMEYAAVMSWILFVVSFAIAYPVIRARNKAAEEA